MRECRIHCYCIAVRDSAVPGALLHFFLYAGRGGKFNLVVIADTVVAFAGACLTEGIVAVQFVSAVRADMNGETAGNRPSGRR